MLNILRSPATRPNAAFVETPRAAGQSNVAWLAQYGNAGGSNVTPLVLIGGVDPLAFRIRVAQAHGRDTFDPSHWSHVFFTALPPFKATTKTTEIPLAGITGFPPLTNGVQEKTLRAYDDPKLYPNIALLFLPVDPGEVKDRIALFKSQRAVLDALDLVVRWLAYLWGAGTAGNPLLEGYGVPSAAMVEVVTAAAGLDLTPNVPSRASFPDAIWQAAKWWQDQQEERQQGRITGVWATPHTFGPES